MSVASALILSLVFAAEPSLPKALDDRLAIELIAAEPEIVTPTGIAVDAKGRILVIESHTHFRPKGYDGPPADRIRVFEDADGDGKMDKPWSLTEDTVHTMNLAVYKDGSVFAATRDEIFRLYRDEAGKVTKRQRIAHLETDQHYPHNALSGFAFDRDGRVYFGMGENFGSTYILKGSDGRADKAAEGGHIFRINADGSNLERIATGFWNPFHLTFDRFGRLFAIENDPDSRPPCRLLHIVEGGDYGYKFHNGRHGRHPFTAWNGELPGTLPMVAGTGEAPSGIVAGESTGFPSDYFDDLLVTSWGDHRIDRFRPEPRGACYQATGRAFIQGGEQFRPVGIVAAPDGSLVVSDWVDKSYDLHKKGRIWRIKAKNSVRKANQLRLEVIDAVLSTTTDQLVAGNAPEVLQPALGPATTQLEAAAIDRAPPDKIDMRKLAAKEQASMVRAAVLRRAAGRDHRELILKAVEEEDPFLQQAARFALGRISSVADLVSLTRDVNPRRRLAALLLLRDGGAPEARSVLPTLLNDSDPDVRLMAIQWVGEHRLTDFRPILAAKLKEGAIDARTLQNVVAALDRIDNGIRPPHEEVSGEEYVAPIVADSNYPPGVRAAALSSLRADHPSLTLDRFRELVASTDPDLVSEAVRALRDSPLEGRQALLLQIATDQRPDTIRAEAIVGLPAGPDPWPTKLLALASDGSPAIRLEALRSLRGATPDDAQRSSLQGIAGRGPAEKDIVRTILEPTAKEDRPDPTDLAAWLKRLDGPADPDVGSRVFFHPRGVGCARCHAIDGRGGRVGPDLSTTGATLTRERLVESILQPSKEVAPQYVSWRIALQDGTIKTGVMLGEDGGGHRVYVDNKGERFKVYRDDVEETKTDPESIMPADLVRSLTDQEFRDLLAFLQRKPLTAATTKRN